MESLHIYSRILITVRLYWASPTHFFRKIWSCVVCKRFLLLWRRAIFITCSRKRKPLRKPKDKRRKEFETREISNDQTDIFSWTNPVYSTRSPAGRLYLWLPCQQTSRWWKPRQTDIRDHLHIVLQLSVLDCHYAMWCYQQTWAQIQVSNKWPRFHYQRKWRETGIRWFALGDIIIN